MAKSSFFIKEGDSHLSLTAYANIDSLNLYHFQNQLKSLSNKLKPDYTPQITLDLSKVDRFSLAGALYFIEFIQNIISSAEITEKEALNLVTIYVQPVILHDLRTHFPVLDSLNIQSSKSESSDGNWRWTTR